ncbi:5-hydroxytryptamine receptor-like isoform X2 [Cylas formicarius]|uniref:5-hydroxytryptamine receptor-like isoform X2 n=1 Tax=Cylas formicarius TaxID=197179 RepID=UPI0029585142|nr:5-hydroxytryptamine receptor-like isoform X2 [Cylas formicarius]
MEVIHRKAIMWSDPAKITALLFLPVSAYSVSSQVFYEFPPSAGNVSSLESLYALNCSTPLCFFNASNNFSLNSTDPEGNLKDPITDVIVMGVLSIVLGLMILVTVIGNVFVIAAILLERNLQNVANYLIVSLAVADLMVACLVMPLGAVYAISNNWIMGPELCDMWTSIDVLCCTASILHLVAIAIDRYWAVTNVDYIHTRNGSRIGIMIVIVWIIALVVSLAPQIPQFKDTDYLYRIEVKKQCLVSQDVKYQIFATSSTFYVPLLVIFALYWKIFQTARKRIRRRRNMKDYNDKVGKTNNNSRLSKTFLRVKRYSGKQSFAAEALVNSLVLMEGQSTTTMEIIEDQEEHVNRNADMEEETTAFTITKPTTAIGKIQNLAVLISNNCSPEKSATNNGSASAQSPIGDTNMVENLHKDKQETKVTSLQCTRSEKKESLEAKRERKAAKTLAIITGAFVMCWLPFFILALVMPLCGNACTISEFIMSFALWLGYFNSTLNPVIYTIFNPEFRQAFKRILCGSHRAHSRNFRSGKVRCSEMNEMFLQNDI